MKGTGALVVFFDALEAAENDSVTLIEISQSSDMAETFNVVKLREEFMLAPHTLAHAANEALFVEPVRAPFDGFGA